MAVRRRLFDEVGPWNEAVGLQGEEKVSGQNSEFFEDTELQDRARKAGGSVWFCRGAIVHHRVDRRAVTPRRITSTAFGRGRGDIWIRELPVWHEIALVPRRNAVACVVALSWGLVRWGVWSLLFRLSRRRNAFGHARRAAFGSGRSLESLRAGRKSMRLFVAARRIAAPAHDLILRLTPDVP